MPSPILDAPPASPDSLGIAARYLAGGGVTGAIVRGLDWSKTPVGPVSTWPQSLLSVVGMLLHSRHPMFLWWGPELIQFYNDSYMPSFGAGKHPAAMGRSGRDTWQETWPIIGPQIEAVMTEATASWHEDALVPIHRNGRIEEVYWTYGYSPVFDERGEVGGTLVVCTETTSRVLANRRTDFLRALGDRLAACGELGELVAATCQACAAAKLDIPFLLTYRRGALGAWSLGGSTPLAAEALGALDELVCRSFGEASAPPRGARLAVEVSAPDGAWLEPTTMAVIVTPRASGAETLVLGVSPRLPFDQAYSDFFDKIAEQLDLAANRLEREKLLVQLEAANHAKDEFLATVSHELRTPLTSILGWAHILAESSEPARLQKGLAVIERNAKAQAQLIEDILDVSRLLSGKVRMNLRRVEPVAVVQAAIEVVRPLAAAKGIQLVERLDPVTALVGDEERIQQLVWNLLSNAVKFTPKGGEIQVSTRHEASRVVITVQDNGKGITPAFLPFVFDRFRQHDNSTTKYQGGLGLGLAIVRHLVELHGGRVVARSEGDGQGASFEVSLPTRAALPKSEPAAHAPGAGRGPRGEEAAAPLSGIGVLLVDDQADARDLLATVLEDAGARVTQAESVAEALRALAAGSFSILVSDIGMPGEDGYSLLEKLRATRASPEVQSLPAIALTAFVRPEDRQRALAAGFQEHTAKPIEPALLVEKILSLARR